ncbi:zinc finger protein 385D-like [Mobula hypostoma]|uniref:zinc finger protein 385D-like n=1 Tax=Mobula hypostoma TaxID=723540 RepID=UPI002FC3CED1
MLMPSSLIPSRFLTLVAHFVIVVNIFWSRIDVVQRVVISPLFKIPLPPSKKHIISCNICHRRFNSQATTKQETQKNPIKKRPTPNAQRKKRKTQVMETIKASNSVPNQIPEQLQQVHSLGLSTSHSMTNRREARSHEAHVTQSSLWAMENEGNTVEEQAELAQHFPPVSTPCLSSLSGLVFKSSKHRVMLCTRTWAVLQHYAPRPHLTAIGSALIQPRSQFRWMGTETP